jgi:hypothetical protein
MSTKSTKIVDVTDERVCFCTPKEFNTKLFWSFISAATFIIVSLPQIYLQSPTESSPAPSSRLIYGMLFFLVTFLTMKLFSSSNSNGAMVKYSLYSTLLFLFVSSSEMYKLTGNVISGVSTASGSPETKGIILHAVVYMVLLLLIMHIPDE